MFAVPNAGKRSPAAARWMRAEGLRPGVPDVWLPAPRGPHPGLVIEHKFGDNKVADEQREWLDGMTALGWRTLVSYSFEQSRQAIVDYLGGK